MSQPRRDWTLARVKVDAEGGRCRICKSGDDVQAAHIIGRTHDRYAADGETRLPEPWVVLTTRIVPLCQTHHRAFDAHLLDLLGHLTPQEEAQAVIDSRGLESARIRLCPSEYIGVAA